VLQMSVAIALAPLCNVQSLKGPPKKNNWVTPVVGGWVKVRKRTRVRFISFDIFFIVFLNSPHRETPKNVIKKKIEKKSVLDFWSNFL
jgi:hypothetical protein